MRNALALAACLLAVASNAEARRWTGTLRTTAGVESSVVVTGQVTSESQGRVLKGRWQCDGCEGTVDRAWITLTCRRRAASGGLYDRTRGGRRYRCALFNAEEACSRDFNVLGVIIYCEADPPWDGIVLLQRSR
jgi:hypothetical protein